MMAAANNGEIRIKRELEEDPLDPLDISKYIKNDWYEYLLMVLFPLQLPQYR